MSATNPQTHKTTFIHLWVTVGLAGWVANDGAYGRINNFLKVFLQPLRLDYCKNANFCVRADNPKEFRASKACSPYGHNIIHDGDLVRPEERSLRLDAFQVIGTDERRELLVRRCVLALAPRTFLACNATDGSRYPRSPVLGTALRSRRAQSG